MKIRLIKKLCKAGYLWWSYWSKAYRVLYHFKYSKATMSKDLSLTEVEASLKKLRWNPDTWKELWDACGSPQRVQHKLNELANGKSWPSTALDCDDFAVWAANALDKNLKEACESILAARKAKEALCWGLFDKDLNLLKCGPGLPKEKIS